MPAEREAGQEKKRLGFRETSAGLAGRGEVTRVSFDEEKPSIGRVTIRFGPKPHRDKDGMTKGPWPEECTLPLPAAEARRLPMGSKVRIRIEVA